MKIFRSSFTINRALRAFLPAAGSLLLAGAAFAAEGGGHGSPHVPWGEVAKQAVNFAILAGVLVYFLRKPVSSFLKERSELMRKSIDDAANARAEAARKLAAIDERMAKLSDEVAQLNAKMDSEAAAEAQALKETVSAEIARIQAQAAFTGEQEVKKARQELQQEASALCAKAAEELVKKTLSPADQERLVKENIEKIEGIVR
ncbi:MAG: ATP synthase F0 subunit B [Thermodesulfobacteriota bacterium]